MTPYTALPMPVTAPPVEIGAIQSQGQALRLVLLGAGALVGYEFIGGVQGALIGGAGAYIGAPLFIRALLGDQWNG